jgi:hypothetical protein
MAILCATGAICCNRTQPRGVATRARADNPAPLHFRTTAMRRIATLSLALACFATLPAWAQQAAPAASAKPTATKRAVTKPAPQPATPREELKSEALGLALAIQTTEAINEAQLEIASRVLTGRADCEYNQTVDVTRVAEKPGLFVVRFKDASYFMVPEETTTGAVRLTDARAGAVWLQIPVKSMLLNSRAGSRYVDRCMHSEQRAAVDAVKDAAANMTAKQ